MPEIEFFATPGYGETQLKNHHYSQAVRIGDRVEISGQGVGMTSSTSPSR